MDTTVNGGRLKFLTVLDEYSRTCLSIKVARSMTGRDVRGELKRLMTLHGPRGFIRCDREAPRSDNGPEFIARATRRFLAEAGIGTLFIDPGAPWQDGYSESFNSRLRDES
jgi:putative transposase